MKTNILAAALGSALVLGAFAFAGGEDYAQAERDAELYKEMVCAGAWGDYKNLKPDCGNIKRVVM